MQKCRHGRLDRRFAFGEIPFVTTQVDECLRIKVFVKHAYASVGHDGACCAVFVLLEWAGVRFTRNPVLTYLQWFKERTELEIVPLCNGIVLMVVAMRAIECQAEEGFTGVLNNIAHPLIWVERIPVSDQ